MPKKLESCVEKLKKEGQEESAAFGICRKAITDAAFNVEFSDRMLIDSASRTVISVRDGVQKYSGAELGMDPEKIYYIYRAPETIKEFAGEMSGLPITDDHVPLDSIPSEIIGKVIDARIIDAVDPSTNTTIKVQNKVQIDKDISARELSLGYRADLIPCDLYDFEQVGIVPHHLAVVERGRCGGMCKFTDEENEDMPKELESFKAFSDADGQINMAQVLQLVADLPEVVKTLPLKDLQKLAQLLTKAMDVATAEIAVEAAEEGAEAVTEEPREVTTEVEDGEEESKEDEEEKKMVAMADAEVKFTDAVTAEASKLNKLYAGVVAKAKDFLESNYGFADKCSDDIMRDALATQHNEKFEDSELSTAFKLLKKNTNYQEFGDSKEGLEALADKEI